MKYLQNENIRVQSESVNKLENQGSMHYFYSKDFIINKFGKAMIDMLHHYRNVPNNMDKWTYKYKIESIARARGLDIWWKCETYDSFWSSFLLKLGSKPIGEMTFYKG